MSAISLRFPIPIASRTWQVGNDEKVSHVTLPTRDGHKKLSHYDRRFVMVTEKKMKVKSNDQELNKSEDYLENLKNRDSLKRLIEISTFSI